MDSPIKSMPDDQVKRGFAMRKRRQIIAAAATMMLILFIALISKRPDIFGTFARNDILAAQVLLIVIFVWFSIFNWRCPVCKKSVGPDFEKRICKHCGARLQ